MSSKAPEPVSLSTSFSSWETAGRGGGLNVQSVLSSAGVTRHRQAHLSPGSAPGHTCHVPPHSMSQNYYCLHVTDKETEAWEGETDKSATAPQLTHGRVEPPDLNRIQTLETLPPGCTESKANFQQSERNLVSACEVTLHWEEEPERGAPSPTSFREGCPPRREARFAACSLNQL